VRMLKILDNLVSGDGCDEARRIGWLAFDQRPTPDHAGER